MATAEPNLNGAADHSNPLPTEDSTDAQTPTFNADATAANTTSAANESTQEPDTLPDTGTDTTSTATTTTTTTPPEKKWPGWPGDCVFRLVVPVGKVGSIIGRKGDLIKKLCEETHARVRVLDAALGTPDRIVSLN